MTRLHAVIMAGGRGTRFWPLSRLETPKQFISIIGDQTFFQHTLNRLEGVIAPDQQWVVGSVSQESLLKPAAKGIPNTHLLLEPEGRNTAPCIAWAAYELLQEDPEAIMAVLPSDHMIQNIPGFQQTLQKAVAVVEKSPDQLVTIGIPPTFPHTGYGYIHAKEDAQIENAFSVIQFKEKPDQKTAEGYIQTGEFFWNSGMFIWKAATLLAALETHLPELSQLLPTLKGIGHDPPALKTAFRKLPSISIDYGLLEKTPETIRMIPAEFDWSDVGSWSTIPNYFPKDENENTLIGTTLTHNSHHNLVMSKNKVVTLCNVDHLAVVETDDALLVMDIRKDQDIKQIIDQLPPELT